MDTRRVVITGMGVLSPLGNTLTDSWSALKEGVSGIGLLGEAAGSGLPYKHGGELKGFCAEDYLPLKDLRRVDAFVQYFAVAAAMACEDAGLGSLPQDTCVIAGSSRGGIRMIERQVMAGRPSAYTMSATTISMAASYASIMLGANGPVLGVSNACASGSSALGEAFRLIKHGYAEVAVTGGAEAPLCRFCLSGYGSMGALSLSGLSRPFDRRRDGFVLSEGAGALVLEERGRALARGALVYAELLGYGNTSDAYHQTVPHREGQVRAMRAALKEAGRRPEEVDYISAHATSTQIGDRVEAASIMEVFGSHRPSVAAVKSSTGHLLGASGAVEAVFAVMSMKEGVVPPTLLTGEPEVDLALAQVALQREITTAVVNSFGFGGVNSVLVLGAAG